MEQTDREKQEEAAALKAAETKAAEEAAALAAKAADNDDEKRVSWTEEEVEAFAAKMYAKGATKSKDAKEVAALKAELDELRTFKEEAAKAARGSQTDEEVAFNTKMETITKEYDAKLGELKNKYETEATGREEDKMNFQREKLKSNVLASASSAGAHDPEDVFVLMESKGFFRRDEETGAWLILNPENGKIRIDVEESGDPLSLKKGVKEFVDDRPHMKRSSGRQGSAPGGGTKGSDREVPAPQGLDVDNLTPSALFANKDKVLAHMRAGGKVSVGGRHNQ